MSLVKIRKGMKVFGSDGLYLGMVDRIEGRAIRLARESPAGGGEDHYLPAAWVRSVDRAVHLDRPVKDVLRMWGADSEGNGLL